MKNLLLLITVLSTLNAASANQRSFIPLEESDVALEQITSGQVISQERLCPVEDGINCFVDGEVVRVELPLGGCLDRLGPVSYVAKQKSQGVVELSIAATNISSSDSFAAFCIGMPSKIVQITLPNFYGKVELKFLRSITQ